MRRRGLARRPQRVRRWQEVSQRGRALAMTPVVLWQAWETFEGAREEGGEG